MQSGTQISERERFNLQQHVLLILLEDCANMLEDIWVKEVYTAVDDVTHKCAWLFNIMQNLNRERKKEKRIILN